MIKFPSEYNFRFNLFCESRVCRLIVLVISASLTFCQRPGQGDNSNFKINFENFYGKEVVIPNTLERMNVSDHLQTDSIDIYSTKPRIISIINADCESCLAELASWKYFLAITPQFKRSDLHIVILLKGSDTQIEKYLIDFPSGCNFYFDYHYDIVIENSIPPDSRLYTFLLDSEGKIVLLGSPYTNNRLRDLYISQLNTLRK